MSQVSTLALYLLMWIALLLFCRRVLIGSIGAPTVRRLERALKLLGKSVLWLALLPMRFAWSLTLLHFRRGRPALAVNGARVADIPIVSQRRSHDPFAGRRRPRRRR
jgi:hypothetical protein